MWQLRTLFNLRPPEPCQPFAASISLLKKVITLQTAMTKKSRHYFQEKIEVTRPVAAPGHTNPSDATACQV